MTSKEAAQLHKELDELLANFGKQHGLTFKPFNLTYGDDFIRFRAEANFSVDADGNEIDVIKKEFEDICTFFGFEKSDYKKTFKGIDGKNYKLTGFKPRARKNVLILQGANRKEYVAPMHFIRRDN